VADPHVVLPLHPFGDQRTVTGLRVAFDAQEHGGAGAGQRVDNDTEIGGFEDVLRVLTHVRRRQLDT
jgi:hypothetical protein